MVEDRSTYRDAQPNMQNLGNPAEEEEKGWRKPGWQGIQRTWSCKRTESSKHSFIGAHRDEEAIAEPE